ncbi:CBS domain-containing protein [Sphingobium sp.]|uniref:CBS domain-containing protein n=1 Tax=Sphingobium sp. TaxID=1912891 RepID=UPI0028BD2F92|nr:CBS domain-containing protein [Sphingobium sp.]
MTVSSAMRSWSDVVTVTPRETVWHVVELLADKRIGAVPVLDGERIIGVMSERDLICALRIHGPVMMEWTIDRVMTSPALTVASDTTVLVALSMMTRRRVRHLPVVEGDRVIGFVSIGDLVKSRLDQIEQEAGAMRAYIQGDYERHINP